MALLYYLAQSIKIIISTTDKIHSKKNISLQQHVEIYFKIIKLHLGQSQNKVLAATHDTKDA
jgi:hypothetical protein